MFKDRWQVELFFIAIKQELKMHTFVGLSKNAVLTQLWIAMIIFLMVVLARHHANFGWTVQRIMSVLLLRLVI